MGNAEKIEGEILGRWKRLKMGGWEGGKVRMGNAEKIEGEILGRWEGLDCGFGIE